MEREVLRLLNELPAFLGLLKGRHVDFLGAIDQVEAVTVAVLRFVELDEARIRMNPVERLVVVVRAWACKWTLPALVDAILRQSNVRGPEWKNFVDLL